MTMDFRDVLDKFHRRRIDRSKNGSTTTADRYEYELVKWAAWLNEERDKWVWQTEEKEAPTYYDLIERLQEMKGGDLSVSMRNLQTSAVSKFYQDLQRFEDRDDYDLPAPAPENPYDRFDQEDRAMYLKGQTKKSKGVQEEGEIYYLSPEKVGQLTENAPAPSLRNELIIRLLFDTGLRRGELAQVKLDHIDRDNRTIYVPPRKSPQDRTVTYTQDYSGFLLDQWLDGTRGRKDRRSVYEADDSAYLFPTNQSDHISGERINITVRKAAESAGLQKVVNTYSDGREIHLINAHTLRHSHGVQAVKSDIDVRRLAESMGHIAEDGTVNLETTEQYLRMAERDYVEASRQFSPYS